MPKHRLLAALLPLSLFATGASAETLTLRFSGLDRQGTVLVALFGSEAGYRGDRPVATARAKPANGAATATFRNLKPGDYAVKAFQDADGDGQLSTNALGIPNEPYAFSNNARGRFGPPGWGKAAFTVGPKGAAQTIRMK